MGKIGAIVQARMGSKRLPGKSLMEINGMPILQIVAERLKNCKSIDEIAVATSTNAKDDAIGEFCGKQGIKCFRGSEEDVLLRFFDCAKANNFATIVRITADCPLIDPATVDNVVEKFRKSKPDYASNVIERSFPRGLDAEVFSFEALSRANSEASGRLDREHVTHYIYLHPEKFRLLNVKAKGALRRPEIRLCIDTEKDFALLQQIFAHFNSVHVKAQDAIKFLDKNPELLSSSIGEEQGYRGKIKAIKQNYADAATKISVGPVKYSDRHWILRLMNQKSVRENSWNKNGIKKADNDAYWKRKLADENFKAFAGFAGKKPACVVRIDKGLVSVAVDESLRGKGIAFAAMNALDLHGCIAEVKPDNPASLALFKKLGFVEKERSAEKIVMEKP